MGIDVGGTFTDLLVCDDDGSTRIFKAPTTPADPSLGVFDALEQAARGDRSELQDFLSGVDAIVHGTTITTNAVLTRSGARTGFITTRGFRDLLAMRRGMKTGERYDLEQAPPPTLVERALTLTVTERVDAKGSIITPLAEDEVRAAGETLRAAEVEAVAVSYLWSFLNPAHELRTREILEKTLPGVYISLSSEVLPQIRVYERHSTTALNSYTGPPLARYLDKLEQRLGNNGFCGVLNIMQSNGGCMSPRVTSRFAVNTLLSGPAGGPGAGTHYGSTHDYNNLISVDMGGTSFDVALVRDGRAAVTSENEVGGFHVAVPMLDIHTVGAGGGSIAGVDDGGILHVGPTSAGPIHAVPIARELGIDTLLVPRESSVFCAAGMLLSDLKHTYIRTCAMVGSLVDFAVINEVIQNLGEMALATFREEQVAGVDVSLDFSADLRYVGQFNEVEVPGFAEGKADSAAWEQLVSRFHHLHDERFGYSMPQAEVELINLRLSATGATRKPETRKHEPGGAAADHARKGERPAWFDNRMITVPVYDGLALRPGNRLPGPAIIEQPTTTIVLPGDTELSCDEWGNYLLET
ncbi:MAG: hydantoinase/oxoprolinase family protein [Gammaproteobacteria bacterium]|nr:hydantoinase/oxoprolinase family protein [Gammaproteobacteria bacterium]